MLTKKILIITALTITMFTLVECSYYTGPATDHYDGSRFYYKKNDGHSLGDMIKWMWEIKSVEWPEWIDDSIYTAPAKRLNNDELKVTFINHATVLIQIDSINILTDPIWSDYAGPFSFLGSERIRKPGVSLENLPPIDYILISHDHYDHLDFPTLEKLLQKNSPVIITGLGVKTRLNSLDYNNIVELDWWQNFTVKDSSLEIYFVPARHQSGRSLFDGNKTLWGGFVIKNKTKKVLFMGDSAFGDFIYKIEEHFAPFDLTILPIGSYEKRWFMKNQHMNPSEAVLIHKILKSRQSIGIHYATFVEHPEQSVDAHEYDLAEAVKKYKIKESEFRILKFGETLELNK